MAYDDNNVESWFHIDQDTTDIEEQARLYVADTVDKWLDMDEDGADDAPTTFNGWREVLGEELAWDKEQNGWDEHYFERMCGYAEGLLPYFLENYPRVMGRVDWDA